MPRKRRGRGKKVAQLLSQPPSQPPSQPSSKPFLRKSLSGAISRLPPELIGEIISQCCTSGEADKVMDKNILLSTSRVSHLWRAESVRFLFREIIITSYKPYNIKSLKPFVKFLKCSPHLRSHIVLLNLEQNGYYGESAALLALHDRDVARIVQLLPNLSSLSIGLSGSHSLGYGGNDQVTPAATANEKLAINHLSIRRPTSPVTITQYLSHFRKIKTLRIVGDGTECIGKIHNSTLHSILEVDSLELTAYSAYLDTLQPIVRPSSLTSLALNAVSKINTASLYAFLNIHGAHLQSFEYVARDATEDITVLGRSCLSACTQLRTISLSLRLHVTSIVNTGIETIVSEWNTCIELITNIPAELEHITLTIPVSNDMWLSALNLDKVKEAIISLPWTSIKDVIDKFSTLQQVEVVLVAGSGSVEAEDMAQIEKGVRNKLGEKTMRKVRIRVDVWEGLEANVDTYGSDDWDIEDDDMYGYLDEDHDYGYGYDSDEPTYAGLSIRDYGMYSHFGDFRPGNDWETWDERTYEDF